MQEDTWATNANAFVAQEDDETQTYSVRIAGFDLLGVNGYHSPPYSCLIELTYYRRHL